MATEIEVRNFQSIEHANLVVEGYTSVVGRSNIGKSALVRAVKAALTGATGTSFVRHGPGCARRLKDAKKCQCKTAVRIKREGFDLLWEKGDNDNRYTFNGQVYDSVERGTPSFLTEGYAPIQIGPDKELLQVADQFDPIFLLNRTGGVVADVLSDVAHLDRVNAAMRLVEKDRREAVSTRKVRELDVIDLTSRLVAFDGLDGTLSRVRAAEDKLVELDAADKRLREVERFIQEGIARATEVKNLHTVEGVVIPDIAACRTSTETFHQLSGWYDRLVTFKLWFERVKGVDALTSPSSDPLKTKLGEFTSVSGFAARYDALSQDVERVEQSHAKVLEEVRGLQAEWDALGVCPTCEQPVNAHMAPHLEAV